MWKTILATMIGSFATYKLISRIIKKKHEEELNFKRLSKAWYERPV